MNKFTVKFALSDSAYMTALRLVAGAICSINDIDVDTSEDFKVCVTESAIILKNCGFKWAIFDFSVDEKVTCTVSGEGGKPQKSENAFSLALVSALVSDCEIKGDDGIIERVVLKV